MKDFKPAQLFNDVSQGPQDCSAYWVIAQDGVKIRLGLWKSKVPKGTIFICPGYSEYIEKYGKTAKLFSHYGYNCVALDWRGHGLSDRLTPNPLLGYVETFSDYLKDFDAIIDWAIKFDIPKPWFVLGHSMGGTIMLRHLYKNRYFKAAAFSCPMWGIKLNPALRIFAYIYGNLARILKMDKNFAPTRSEKGYIDEHFDKNALTNDPEMWQYLREQVARYPALKLGGPSVRWVNSALQETYMLSKLPSPKIPCITFLAEDERIVDPDRINDRMKIWPAGVLHFMQSARHEVLMEDIVTQEYITQKIANFFTANNDLVTD